jgi:hypothetical protein
MATVGASELTARHWALLSDLNMSFLFVNGMVEQAHGRLE